MIRQLSISSGNKWRIEMNWNDWMFRNPQRVETQSLNVLGELGQVATLRCSGREYANVYMSLLIL